MGVHRPFFCGHTHSEYSADVPRRWQGGESKKSARWLPLAWGLRSGLATMVLEADSPGLRGCPEGLGRARSTYVRRRPEDTVLHHVVREHLETFLAEARLRGGGEGLPRFVERELREFLSCGVLASGFARFRCTDCAREVLVAFSC